VKSEKDTNCVESWTVYKSIDFIGVKLKIQIELDFKKWEKDGIFNKEV